MDSKTPEIKPLVLEPWVMQDHRIKEPDSVKPVPKGEGTSFPKLNKESGNKQRDRSYPLNPAKAKELTEEIQRFLSDIKVSVSFEIYDNTGELVVKVINSDTKEVIRQIPPEELLKFRDKLEELRGVLFAGKA